MRVVLIGCFQDLHAVDADPRPHRVLRASQAKFGHAVQQHVVELAEEKNKTKQEETLHFVAEHVKVQITAILVQVSGTVSLQMGAALNSAGNLNYTDGRHSAWS